MAAFKLASGGLASIERYLETLINTRFYVLKMISYPHLYPQFVFDTPVEEYISYRVRKIFEIAET